ncbi:hypothetical protein A5714_10200 [Mycobacterium sp. E2462]|uniref:DUF732 domain-containing protein n=1 Tax=unclassified Mycobacterium TaxID=2642494 RepID=UPI0008000246|nr:MULTISPECIES: DUF732 domain-containing protein [unclassified Mycobacterium]OBG77603.1 hypothetical protein A5700_18820 [Mycobacterium sp. E1214]OBH21868.1 hypothetical protein A5693_15170 [Mycobacterium sp. E1319]OBI17600.1 hypothetical protein A5714_10200 [Mycobacterium sp. E2462]
MNAGLGRWAALTAALGGAALLFAGPASADATDDAFIGALQRNGINFPDRNAAINAGHSVCSGLSKGQTRTFVVLSLVKNTDLNVRESGYLLGASMASYCPQFRGNPDLGS